MVNSSWAFKPNEEELCKQNAEHYESLKGKYLKVYADAAPTPEQLKEFVVYRCVGHGYAVAKYKILSNPFNLTNSELALICDDGNLCFGYRQENGLIVIHTD